MCEPPAGEQRTPACSPTPMPAEATSRASQSLSDGCAVQICCQVIMGALSRKVHVPRLYSQQLKVSTLSGAGDLESAARKRPTNLGTGSSSDIQRQSLASCCDRCQRPGTN